MDLVKGDEAYKCAKEYERKGEDREAFKYYLLAAKAGNPDAQYGLGMMYLGERVPQLLGNLEELLEAYRWFLLASKDPKYKVPIENLKHRFEDSDPGGRVYDNLLQKLVSGDLTPTTRLAPQHS